MKTFEAQGPSPERSEMAEVIASFSSFLETQRRLKMEEIESEEELLAAYRDVTEYQFLITHYVVSQAENPGALCEMWHALKEIARTKGEQQNFSMFQRGVVTQVATHRVFQELGFNPRFAHPSDDAFKKIDLWSDATHAIQVKGSARESFGIFETDKIGPSPVEIMDGKTRKLFDGDIRSFRTKLKGFGADVKGYFIVIPSDKIDFTTGKPSEELVALVRQKIGPRST
jgi:hypothetical protein